MEEFFDILDERGCPTGEVAPRAAVHRDGRWHRAFHLLICGRWEGDDRALLQLRAADKDVSPGVLDVSVGGHFRAGEGIADVVREVEEEVGLVVTPGELTFLWSQRAEHREGPILDREWQEVYLLRRDAPVEAYRPDPVELAGLVGVSLRGLDLVLRGERSSVNGPGLYWDGHRWRRETRAFGLRDFIAADRENLTRLVARALRP